MNDLTPEQNARALELYNVWGESRGYGRIDSMLAGAAHAWLAVEAHVLATLRSALPSESVGVRNEGADFVARRWMRASSARWWS